MAVVEKGGGPQFHLQEPLLSAEAEQFEARSLSVHLKPDDVCCEPHSSGKGRRCQLTGIWREGAAEFMGTFIMVSFGVGSVAQFLFSEDPGDCKTSHQGSELAINLAWGFAVFLGICFSRNVSGAHLNPAVTVAMSLRERFGWRKMVVFIVAQILGGYAGACLVHLVYWSAMHHFADACCESKPFHIQISGGCNIASVFATYPQAYVTLAGGFLDQVVGTALLLAGISAITDKHNAMAPWTQAMGIGVLVTVIGMAFGLNAGYAINPARDFGPRLYTATAGWGVAVFQLGNGWWWVPIVAPIVGGLVGSYTYDVLIGWHHPHPGVAPHTIEAWTAAESKAGDHEP